MAIDCMVDDKYLKPTSLSSSEWSLHLDDLPRSGAIATWPRSHIGMFDAIWYVFFWILEWVIPNNYHLWIFMGIKLILYLFFCWYWSAQTNLGIEPSFADLFALFSQKEMKCPYRFISRPFETGPEMLAIHRATLLFFVHGWKPQTLWGW